MALAMVLFVLAQAISPFVGSYASSAGAGRQTMTVEPDRLILSDLTLQTTTEWASPYIAGDLAVTDSSEQRGYVEVRAIHRAGEGARGLCHGRLPTHVILTTVGEDRIGVSLIRRTLWGEHRCAIASYLRL